MKFNFSNCGLVMVTSVFGLTGGVAAQNSSYTTSYFPPAVIGKRLVSDKDVMAAFRDYYGQAVQVESVSEKVLSTSTPEVGLETNSLPYHQTDSSFQPTQHKIYANSYGYMLPQNQTSYYVQPVQQQVQQIYYQQPQYVQEPVYIHQPQYISAPVSAYQPSKLGTQYYVSYEQKVVPTVETRTVQVLVNKTVKVPQYYKANVYTNVYHGPVMPVGSLPSGIQYPSNSQARNNETSSTDEANGEL